jgi:hypothetical protein
MFNRFNKPQYLVDNWNWRWSIGADSSGSSMREVEEKESDFSPIYEY